MGPDPNDLSDREPRPLPSSWYWAVRPDVAAADLDAPHWLPPGLFDGMSGGDLEVTGLARHYATRDDALADLARAVGD